MRLWGMFLAAAAALACSAGPAGAAKLSVGIGDPIFDGADAATWLTRATDAGAASVRLTMSWADTAPNPPAAATDPASAGYDFAKTDAAVRAASAAGVRVLLLVSGAPRWAEGPDRPAGVNDGTWKPDPQAFGQFMEAVARRYDGRFVPAGGGGALPRVEAFQLWNEPNLSVYLTPQWTGGRRAFSPRHYREMVNAAYPRIHAASPRALVVMAGTAPYGDPVAGNPRMPPARFVRELLCLRGTAIDPRPSSRCPDPVKLDVMAHHPYGVGNPFEPSYWPDDVTMADLDRLKRAFAVAVRARHVLPAGRKPFWVTEFGWESKPDPTGLTQSRQAQWLGEAALQMHRAGVARALWYRVHDDAPVPSYGRSVQSGLYTRSGKAKRAAAMLRFPVAVVRRKAGRNSAFALPPAGGTCRVQRRSGPGAAWRTVVRVRCRAKQGFTRTVARKGQVRVAVGALRSPVVTSPR